MQSKNVNNNKNRTVKASTKNRVNIKVQAQTKPKKENKTKTGKSLPQYIAKNYADSLIAPWIRSIDAKIPGTTATTAIARKGTFSISIAANSTYLLMYMPDQLISSAFSSNFYLPYNTIMNSAQISASNGIQPFSAGGQAIDFSDLGKFRTVSAYVSCTNLTAPISRSLMGYSRILPVRLSSGVGATAEGNLPVPRATPLNNAAILWPAQVSNITNFTNSGATAINLSGYDVLTQRWYTNPENVSRWSVLANEITGHDYSDQDFDVHAIFMMFENNSANAQVVQFRYAVNYEIVSSPTSVIAGTDVVGKDAGKVPESTLSYLVDNALLSPIISSNFLDDTNGIQDFRQKLHR